MRLAATKSSIVCLSAGVRFASLAFPADLLAFLLDLLGFNFFTDASSTNRTRRVCTARALCVADPPRCRATTKVIELSQAIEEYGASPVPNGSRVNARRFAMIFMGIDGPLGEDVHARGGV